MILCDTSAWVEHFRPSRFTLAQALQSGEIIMHPVVLGEIALGSLSQRARILGDLAQLPQIETVSDEEVLMLIEARHLCSRGIGLVEVHLLASVMITPGVKLATFDKHLAAVASELDAGGLADEVMS